VLLHIASGVVVDGYPARPGIRALPAPVDRLEPCLESNSVAYQLNTHPELPRQNLGPCHLKLAEGCHLYIALTYR
jgi:hypothetical protein